jgi:putative DNA primase/helicase
MGYSVIGEVREHILPCAIGSGRNGKGVFFETQIAVLGDDYATTAPAGFLMAKGTQHETEIARLAGRRLVVASETNEGDRFDEQRVKQLTGGDRLTARFMRENHFTFPPSHTLCLMANHRPDVRAGGPAFWSRLLIIPFNNVVPPEKQIKGFDKILAREDGPAVLAWIIEGAAAYVREGLQEPASVTVATQEYEAEQDTVARFLEERCHLGGHRQVTLQKAIVRAAYERFCREGGESPVSPKALTQALKRRGVEEARTGSARLYVGITLLAAEDGVADVSPAVRFHQPAPPQLGDLP